MASIIGKVLGEAGGQAIGTAVSAIGGVLDDLFTSDEELAKVGLDRQKLENIKAKLAQEPHIAQTRINQIEAQHRSIFVAGWRPAIGWTAAAGLFAFYVPQYALASYIWVMQSLEANNIVPYPATADGLLELVIALLGLGGLRTFEKVKGRAK